MTVVGRENGGWGVYERSIEINNERSSETKRKINDGDFLFSENASPDDLQKFD